MNNIRSRVMHMAHILYKPGFKWSEILSYAWYFIYLRRALLQGVATFSYFKQDRSIREARGTLSDLLIPEEDKPKGVVNRHPNFGVINYYDIDKKAWRSFRITDFIGFVTYYRLVESSFLKEKRTKRE